MVNLLLWNVFPVLWHFEKKNHHNRKHYHYINWKKTLGLKLNSLLRTIRTTLTFKLLSLLELLMKSSVYVKIRASRVRVVTFCTPMETNTILSTPCVLNSIRNTMLLHVWISNYLGSLQNLYIEDRRMSINWIIVCCIWNSYIKLWYNYYQHNHSLYNLQI